MKYHIGYYGGVGGDFLRGLIVSGLKDIKTKFEDGKLLVKFDNYKPVITINSSGKINVCGPIEIDDDRYRGIRLGHNIGKQINQLKEYYIKCQNQGLDFQKFLISYPLEQGYGRKNGWTSNTSVSVGHEHINFFHTFGNLNEWHQHIRDRRKTDKIIYMTISTLDEANQRWINNSQKNNPDDNRRLPTEDESLKHFHHHKEIHDIVAKEKHDCDMIFPFRYIYKKELLREWLREEFDWNDRCYDALYDAWYSKQDVIIDK